MKRGQMLIFTGNSNKLLTDEICSNLKMPLGNALVGKFSEGETKIKVNEDVR